MSTSSEILSDARWLPHAFDPVRGAIDFVRIERARLSEPAFLADAKPARPADRATLALEDIRTATAEEGAPLHFIFHTAFCRSTLLVRALEIPGLSAGLSEPGIIASLAGAGRAAEPAIAPALGLLARPWGKGEAVIVKPTNHANRLIPALMQASPASRAVLVTNPLPSFLAAVVRKGMLGRRWARGLYAEVMGYAGMDLGMDGREQFAMTDLQAGALAWFLNQRYFDALRRQYGKRVRLINGDAFAREPARTLDAVGAFTGIALDGGSIAHGPVFTADAKTGEDYAAKSARDAQATQSAVIEDEIAKTGEWIGLIAQQAGLRVPLASDLP